MFKIKICGITNKNDALQAVRSGADAIGLNFYPRSLRSVLIDDAVQILSALTDEAAPAKAVGVFVNESTESIRQKTEACRLDLVQLHGDESPDILTELDGIPCLRAIRAATLSTDEITREIDAWVDAGVAGFLLDSGAKGVYGGTGQTLNWPSLQQLPCPVPLTLAGGLNPSNVAQAIAITRIKSVDTASGVEDFPGKKNATQVEQFIRNAQAAINLPA